MSDDPKPKVELSKLGQFYDRIASERGTQWLIRGLIFLCVIFVLLDLTYDKHGYMEMEHYIGFYAAYGFVMFTGLILVAKALRRLVKRPEDYYAPHSIDVEDYPEDELQKADHND